MSNDQDRTISSSGHDITPLTPEAKREKSKDLDELARWVANEAGTERPFTGKYYKEKAPGLYVCAVCGLPLFSAETKYESGSGWPSFYDAIDSDHVLQVPEIPGTGRIELRCARSGTHLGHVFDDGPAPTGQRYCVNSASLEFIAEGAELPEESRPVTESARGEQAGAMGGADAAPLPVATFGAGCFWGVEAAFRQLEGVVATQVGYTGGTVEQPTYHQVCADRTGHAEAVEVRFDPDRVSYEKLLSTFWSSHDPTQLDRQGPDVGSQYRSTIFFHDEEQRQAALASKAELEESRHFSRPIVTEITAAVPFYRAEEYHQQYLEKNGTMSCPTHLAP